MVKDNKRKTECKHLRKTLIKKKTHADVEQNKMFCYMFIIIVINYTFALLLQGHNWPGIAGY